MKVVAHVMVSKGYGVALAASQWRHDLELRCEAYNQQSYAAGDDEEPERSSAYLAHDRSRVVVTVEFEVPDSAFKREPPATVPGTVLPNTGVCRGTPSAERAGSGGES